jgi:hypothetical protein
MRAEGRKLFAINLGKDDEELREAGVRDEHLLAIEHPLAILQHCGGLRGKGVGSGALFGERVGADDLAAREAGQPLLFLRLGSEVHDGQGSDTGMAAQGDGEAAGASEALCHQHRGGLGHVQTAPGLGDVSGQQPDFPGLLHELDHEVVVLGLEAIDFGLDLVGHELARGLRKQERLFAEVLWREDLLGLGRVDEKAAATGNGLGLVVHRLIRSVFRRRA